MIKLPNSTRPAKTAGSRLLGGAYAMYNRSRRPEWHLLVHPDGPARARCKGRNGRFRHHTGFVARVSTQLRAQRCNELVARTAGLAANRSQTTIAEADCPGRRMRAPRSARPFQTRTDLPRRFDHGRGWQWQNFCVRIRGNPAGAFRFGLMSATVMDTIRAQSDASGTILCLGHGGRWICPFLGIASFADMERPTAAGVAAAGTGSWRQRPRALVTIAMAGDDPLRSDRCSNSDQVAVLGTTG